MKSRFYRTAAGLGGFLLLLWESTLLLPACRRSGAPEPHRDMQLADAAVADAGPRPDGGTPKARPTSTALIKRAAKRGRLSPELALLYRGFAAVGDPRLPEEYRGDDRAGGDCLVLDELSEHWASLPPAIREQFWADPGRPPAASRTGSAALNPSMIDPGVEWDKIEAVQGKVWVWYQVLYGAEERTTAEKIAAALNEPIYPTLTGLMGRTPASDSNEQPNGGSGALDVFLVHAGFPGVTSGYHHTGPRCTSRPVQIRLNVMDRELDEVYSTLAHEMMHALQDTFTASSGCEETKWLMEATATWAEDYVYPTLNKEHRKGPYYQTTAMRPLEDSGESLKSNEEDVHPRPYGAYLFFYYLTHRTGNPDIIRKIFEGLAQSDSLTSIDNSITEQAADGSTIGVFKKYWADFAVENLNFPGNTLYRQDDYTMEPHDELYLADIDQDIYPIEKAIEHLSMRYPSLDATAQVRTVTFLNGYTFKLVKKSLDVTIDTVRFSDSASQVYTFEPIPLSERKGIHVQAVFTLVGSTEVHREDWTERPFRTLCLDKKDERVQRLVVVVSNGQCGAAAVPYLPKEGELPAFQVSPIGCWHYRGNASTTGRSDTPSQKGQIRQAEDDVLWERLPGDITYPYVSFAVKGGQWSIEGDGRDGDCSYSIRDRMPLQDGIWARMYGFYGVLNGPSYRRYSGIALVKPVTRQKWVCPPEVSRPNQIGLNWWFWPDVYMELYHKRMTVTPEGNIDLDATFPSEGASARFQWQFKPDRDADAPQPSGRSRATLPRRPR